MLKKTQRAKKNGCVITTRSEGGGGLKKNGRESHLPDEKENKMRKTTEGRGKGSGHRRVSEPELEPVGGSLKTDDERGGFGMVGRHLETHKKTVGRADNEAH